MLREMAESNLLAPDTVVVAAKGPVSCVVGDAMVILDPATGNYFGTGEVGARILALIAEPVTVGEVCRRIVDEYEVSAGQAAGDVDLFLRTLIERGLAQARSGVVSG